MIRRDSTDTELDALQAVSERLGGFAPHVNAEWLDGVFAALLAGPSVPESPAAVMPLLLGDAWGRTFGDPEDVQQASDALETRWRVLRSQLDPDLLWDDPDRLQLAALLLAPDEDGAFPLGSEWAEGFRAVVDDPQWGWGATIEPETVAAMLGPVDALRLDPDALAAWTAEHYGEPPSREQLVDDAGYAVQDLRLWWIDNAPRTPPRRAEALPGRNDPCFCGSGKKFKKCHGAG
jgi:uncharacterized protein